MQHIYIHTHIHIHTQTSLHSFPLQILTLPYGLMLHWRADCTDLCTTSSPGLLLPSAMHFVKLAEFVIDYLQTRSETGAQLFLSTSKVPLVQVSPDLKMQGLTYNFQMLLLMASLAARNLCVTHCLCPSYFLIACKFLESKNGSQNRVYQGPLESPNEPTALVSLGRGLRKDKGKS